MTFPPRPIVLAAALLAIQGCGRPEALVAGHAAADPGPSAEAAADPDEEAASSAARPSEHVATIASSPVVFEIDVRPILQERCSPCHFSGGIMHEKLPFDRARTIRALGEKLFTRIGNEDEQSVIRAFQAQVPLPDEDTVPPDRR